MHHGNGRQNAISQVLSEQTYSCKHVNTANIDDTHEILCLNILLLYYYYRAFKGHYGKGFLSPSSWFFFSSVAFHLFGEHW